MLRRTIAMLAAAAILTPALGAATPARSETRTTPTRSTPTVGHHRVPVGPAAAPAPASWRGTEPPGSFHFDAIGGDRSDLPADPTGALGVRWVMTAVDGAYALYDLAGRQVIGPNAISGLFETPRGTRFSDPDIVYDGYDDRFVLAYLAIDAADRRSWIYLVSVPDTTATEPSTWCGARIAADRTKGDGVQFPDRTALGFGRDHVVVTANMYGAGGGFRGATALAFPKARLYDCSRKIAFATFTGRETNNPTGSPASTLQPAVTVGEGRAVYLTSIDPGRRDLLVLWRLAGEGTDVQLRRVALGIPDARHPRSATQGGGTVDDPNTWWDPGGGAVSSAFADLDRNEVFAAHVVAADLGPDASEYTEAAGRWYAIDPAGVLARSRVARVGTVGVPGTDAGWPSLATAIDGTLFVSFARASAITGEFLSAWVAEVSPGSTDATLALLAAGTARLEAAPGPEPWGTSTATTRDPVDGRFVASIGQVPVGPGPTTDGWRQTVDVVGAS